MKLIKKITSVLCALMMAVMLIIPKVSYASNYNIDRNKVEESFYEMYDIAKVSEDIKDANTLEYYKNLAKETISDSDAINTQVSVSNLNFDDIKVVKTNLDSKTYTSVSIPIKNESYSLLSSLVLVYNNDKIETYVETLFTNDNNKFKIDTYIDGDLLESKSTDIDYVSDKEVQKGLDELHKIAKNKVCPSITTPGVGKIAACIAAVVGVNAGVAYLIAGTCAASCPAVVPICVACIAGVCTMGAGDVKAIVECFKL